jgi:hypothetical protein
MSSKMLLTCGKKSLSGKDSSDKVLPVVMRESSPKTRSPLTYTSLRGAEFQKRIVSSFGLRRSEAVSCVAICLG